MCLQCVPFRNTQGERRKGEPGVQQTRGRKGSPAARPWQHLVWGNMEELYAQGQDAEWGSGEGRDRTQNPEC